MSDLFAVFNIAKRGLATQQKAIGVTSHNISNANTKGYSRQRAIIETTKPFGMPSANNAIGPGQVGTGSTVKTIQRVRDEFLDYQVRNETSTQGKYEARNKFLSEIENIFNEPSDSGLSTLTGKFFDSWQQLSKQPQSSNARTVVVQQSAALANELNHLDSQFSNLKQNVQLVLKESVFNANNLLNQLDQLNQQIIGVKVAGQEPNDLLDRRDVLTDKISKMLNINIDKRDFYGVDISPIDTKGVPNNGEKLLIRKEPNYAVSRFSYINNVSHTEPLAATNDIKITYFKGGNSNSKGETITIKDVPKDQVKDLERYITETRVLWAQEDGSSYVDGQTINFSQISNGTKVDTEKLTGKLGLFIPSSGEMKGYMTVQQDVDKYVDQMDKLAKSIAFTVNGIHSGRTSAGTPAADPSANPTAADYMPFFVNKDTASYTNNTLNNLANTLNDEKEITAGNISINKELLNDVMKIKTRTNDDQFAYAKDNNLDGETDGNRALAIAQMRNKLVKIQEIGDTINSREDLFGAAGGNTLKGLEVESNTNGMTIDNYFKDVIDELGIQAQEAKRIVKNQASLLAGFEESRESISGVSLDEEMANMIQYQHAYQANAKIVSVVDELLDVVINGLKR